MRRRIHGGGVVWGGLPLLLIVTATGTARAKAPPPAQDQPVARLVVEVRSEAGEPVTGASVRLAFTSASGIEATVPLEEMGPGRYRAAGVSAGSYVLMASALGFEATSREVTLEGGEVRVSLVLGIRPVALSDLVAAVERTESASLPGHAVSRIPLDGGPRTLSDRLAEEPGVQVRSSPGGREIGSVRGSRSEGLLVLLDGLPVNDPLTGVADLSRIPVATLEAASLVRGASPRFGSGAIGGVLLLESRKPEGVSSAVGVEVGSYGSLAADAYVSLGGSPGTLALGFRAEGVENDFEFPNRAKPGSPVEVRRNADGHALHVWLSGAPSALPIFAQARFDDVERGAPGRIGSSAFDEARYGDRSLQMVLGYGSSVGRVSAIAARRSLLYRDPSRNMESRQSLTSFRLAGSTWIPGAALEINSYVARERVAGSGTEGTPVRWSGGVWAGKTFTAGRLSVQPGLAADISTDGHAVSPEVSLAAQLGPAWVLWSRLGQAYRLPTFADVYAPRSRGVRANPDLKPERVVVDAEIGIRWASAAKESRAGEVSTGGDARAGGDTRAGIQAAIFYRRTNDPIVWVASSVALWSPRNLDQLTAAGVEIGGDIALASEGPRIGGAFTLQRSRLGFGTNKNPMPYQPDLAANVYLLGELAGVWLRGAVALVGSRTTTVAGVRRLPAYTTVRLDGSRAVRIGSLSLEVAVTVENLLDSRFELTELFPEPGRSLVVRLEVR
ncbi:MAG: TonB-dependent receptor [Gemmatimonadota bacterium]